MMKYAVVKVRSCLALMTVVAIASVGSPVLAADSLPVPTGDVILEVTGAIENTNGDGKASFDYEMLEALGMQDLQTSTAWTEGQPVFNGVLVKDLLEYVGAKGDSLFAVALNDYKVEIPVSDFVDYPVILASSMNGDRLKIRDKGPLWIVYPRDQYAELNTKENQGKWIWQLKELTVN